MEHLEGRLAPATFVVNTVDDSGPGSLRAAIQAANADPTPTTITFDPRLNGLAIALELGPPLPTITANGLTIQGPGPNNLTVGGEENGPVLSVGQGVSGVTVSGLTITGGGSTGVGGGTNRGGGIANAGALALIDCVVTQNSVQSEGSATSGGGIANDGTMTITRCVVSANTVSGKTGSVGAGIDNRGQMTVTDSTLSGNIASGPFLTVAGGGISNFGTLTLLRCTVSGNQATPGAQASASGGGVAALGSSVTTMIDCTVASNSSPGGGGVQILGGTLALTNCTVARNVGGGIALAGGAPAVVLQNTIAAQNQSGPDVSGAVQSGGDNLVGDPTGASGLLPGDLTNVDPLLGPLQSNGGPTQTLALLPGSPALDAGSNAAPGLPATDQRGFNRVVNTAADIGAYEYQPPGTTVTLTAAPNPAVRGRPVTFTVTVTGTAPGSNTPTGAVSLRSPGTSLATGGLLQGGTATVPTSVLPAGAYVVTATYSGDVNFTGGTSASMSVQVNLPPPASAGVFDPTTATWYLRSSASAGPPDAGEFAYGGAGWLPVAGDWQGGGTTGIGAFDPSTATWYLRNEAGAGAPDAGQFQYGGAGWLPVAGDWSGAGHSGVGAFDPSTATWYLRNEDGAGAPDREFRFGVAGAIPVVGDWLGFGLPSVGVFDPATATWYLRDSATPGAPFRTFQFGGIGFLPVVGDWTGTGHAGIGVVDPTTGIWYLRSSASAGAPDAGVFAYGGAGWLPVAGAFAAPQFLLAQGGEGAGASGIGSDQLQATVAAALERLSAAGVDPALVSDLASASYAVGALPPGVLGQTAAGRVTLSADGAGRGWFVDTTPLRDEEFAPGSSRVALPGSPAAGKEDLLTAVLHEMGHLAGNPDGGTGVMTGTLAPGTRDTLALDQVFSRGAL